MMSRCADARLVSLVAIALLVCLVSGAPRVVLEVSAQVTQTQESPPAGAREAAPPVPDVQPQTSEALPQSPESQPQTSEALPQSPESQPQTSEALPPPIPKPTSPAAAQSVARLQQELLLRENFTFIPAKMFDPFTPAITPADTPVRLETEEEDGGPPEPKAPLTPLQKMSVGEIEKGLKAIMWGEMGRRALIEDSSGKGYIVGEGTPVGEHEGVLTQIFNDHLVIQQEFWDRGSKKMVAQNSVIRLKKLSEKK